MIMKNNNKNKKHIWHPYTRFSALRGDPLPVMERGEGVYLYDKSGKQYLDAISSWWCASLGHSHPRLLSAISRQSKKLQHSILGNMSHEPAEVLAQRLCAKMQSPDYHAMFCSDGSSAIEAALKISLQYFHNIGKPEKNAFMTLSGDYHGDTLGSVSVGYVEGFHEPFAPMLRKSFTVDLPDYESGQGIVPSEKLMEAHGSEICAVILEPLCQGASGMRMYDAQYLRDIADLCHRHDIILIIDEIAMGFGRTGKYWAYEHAGISPDIVCVGKAVTGGYLPLSAAICSDRIYDTFSDMDGEDHTFYHGHTFAGNPLAAACAVEAMSIYDEMDAATVAACLGNQMKDILKPLGELDTVANVRCLGLIGAVEMVVAEKAAQVRDRLMEQGVIVRPLGEVLYLMPPLVITDEQMHGLCNQFVDAVRGV